MIHTSKNNPTGEEIISDVTILGPCMIQSCTYEEHEASCFIIIIKKNYMNYTPNGSELLSLSCTSSSTQLSVFNRVARNLDGACQKGFNLHILYQCFFFFFGRTYQCFKTRPSLNGL